MHFCVDSSLLCFFFFFQAEDGIRDKLVTGVQTCAFFFQAEDGIRDKLVTGVQTCALPISGRDPRHAAVAVTHGILRILNAEELEGVLAHELSHVKNRDILIGSIAATLAATVMVIANMARWAALFGGGQRDDREGANPIALLAGVIPAPLAATPLQLALSPAPEF